MAQSNRPRGSVNTQGFVIPDSFENESFRSEYDASDNPIYIGYAVPGSSESASVWQISKQTYDASGNMTEMKWPTNSSGAVSNDYEFVWADRATYTYS